MKLPILGIIIIIFLQLGFTAYNTLDRPIGSLHPISSLMNGTNPVAVLPDNSITEAYPYDNVSSRFQRANKVGVTSAANISKSRRQDAPAGVFTNMVIKIPAAKHSPEMLQLIAMQKRVDSAATRYPPSMRPGGESEKFSVKADRPSEKRSFVAKSVSVMKKPYDWIKALGSKFN